ncbi:MAG: nucleoside deaminase [Hyphomicrobiaceae bacterium]|nr:nucleoside deaminase [Hyphomicrobiaceae bacterium]
MNEDFMRRAIEIARESLDEEGALPYGAVVVKEGEIIGEGLNRSHGKSDPTSHGEVEAIREACRRLGTPTLPGCDLYTSCEPCAMCVATMYIAEIENLYYASTIAESAVFFGRLVEQNEKWSRRINAVELRREVGLPIEERSMPAQRILGDLGQEIFDDFVDRQNQS